MGNCLTGYKLNKQRIWENAGLPILFVVAAFIFYSLLGYERGLQWHSVRKGTEAIILLSAVSAVTGCSLKKKLWYPSYIVLFMYIVIYPMLIGLGRKGWLTDSGMMATENGQYEERYDLFSSSYTLPLDMALTKHGQEHFNQDNSLNLHEAAK